MRANGRVLVVGGSDSSGGAGIVRDIATLAAMGLSTSVAVTAVTVQTHAAVIHVEVIPAALVAAQMRAALEADAVGAIKIGMLPTADVIDAVCDVLDAHPVLPVIVDPVLAASSGGALAAGPGLAESRRRLFRLASLVAPNLPELAALAGGPTATNAADALGQARHLLDAGAGAVLVKGGHGDSGEMATDILLYRDRPPRRFTLPRLQASMRGTGCALSSAVAGGLAAGLDTETAISQAKAYVHAALVALQ
ncbi:bifunctional hydroxymethylpyrimidine kinase/phosphomethylpyrimidine kinase [Rhizobium alarense]|uniref:bifunctional hydroxymethylpyrimidine kinase/phosphomethylpyrimidine kinase n=1 Tax=Rhizobium alarense TaxID=2846851 RepID=UPI002E2FBD27|nr:hydroxymethylpyrimidine/phosphomethylpyrimidine kinase [Rhizobium alarense]